MGEINLGDVVFLKSEEGFSSKNLMTVASYHDTTKDSVWCCWFHEGEVKEHRFKVVSLMKYE